MGENIKFIEFMSSDFCKYKIDKKDIYMCDVEIKHENIEEYSNGVFKMSSVPMVKSLILVVSYKWLSQITNAPISEILIYNQDKTIRHGYVNLTTTDFNKNQFNHFADDKIFITIEEK